MTNIESKKHGLFDKNRKEKKENIGYQAIGGSWSSLDASNIIMSDADHKIEDGIHINATVNLKKSKTFKIIVNKKAKEKEKNSKSENFKKPKNKKRKRKEMKTESIIEESIKEKETMRPIFGVSLKEACKNSKSHDGYLLPAFFRQCINYLESENRLSFEGIYRIPGVNSQIAKLKQSLLSDVDIDGLLCNFDIAVITSIVKSFLRDLKPELIEKPLEALIFKTVDQHKDNVSEKVSAIKSIIIENLPMENRLLLALIIGHMGKIIDLSSQNKMSLENLLIVLSPALHLHFGLLKLFYDHSSELFGDLQVPIYVPPMRPSPQHEEELPETVEGINEELKKQISYLDDLHLQINEGFQNDKTEYLIWDVQLIVTKLKRKKYIAELNDPDLIKIELKKYERQLEKIHKDMLDSANTAVPSNSTSGSVSTLPVNASVDQSNMGAPSSMDQELWQIQRTITTLNRKLRGLTTSTLPRPHTGSIAPVITNQKGDNFNDDDDDESIQLNLTLRKLPLDSSEMMDDEVNSESDRDQSKTEDNTPCSNGNSDAIVPECENIVSTELIPDENGMVDPKMQLSQLKKQVRLAKNQFLRTEKRTHKAMLMIDRYSKMADKCKRKTLALEAKTQAMIKRHEQKVMEIREQLKDTVTVEEYSKLVQEYNELRAAHKLCINQEMVVDNQESCVALMTTRSEDAINSGTQPTPSTSVALEKPRNINTVNRRQRRKRAQAKKREQQSQ